MKHLLANIAPQDLPVVRSAADHYRANYPKGLTKLDVRQVNAERGTDFATALLYAHFAAKLSSLREADDFSANGSAAAPDNLLIAIAPGAFHEEHPEVGGDGRDLMLAAKSRGWRCEQIPTMSLGTLDTNARIIVDWLERHRDEHLVLVSLSKGTADVMAALAEWPELRNSLAAWVSVSGILAGTPMSNWLLDKKRLRPVFWFMRWRHAADVQAVRDLRHGTGERLSELSYDLVSERTGSPSKFHIAGFPLRRHLSCWRARLWHRRFRQAGPTDSVILLEDLLDADGTVIPVWGADHYLKSSWNPSKAVSAIAQASFDLSETKQF